MARAKLYERKRKTREGTKYLACRSSFPFEAMSEK